MNKQRRNELNTLVERIQEIKARVDELIEQEQEYLDAIPENLQNSQRYSDSEEAINQMESVGQYLEDAQDVINEITNL